MQILRTSWAVIVAAAVSSVLVSPTNAQQVATDAPKPLTLSAGAVKDAIEGSITRALVKYSNDAAVDDALVNLQPDSFYVVRRKFDFDVGDKNTLSGATLRYGATRFAASTTTVDGLEVVDTAGWVHTVPITLGLDADRGFKNRDALLEVGYVPFKGGGEPSCFKLGGNPIIGLVAQLGHRSREAPAADFKSSLQRVKVEMRSKFELGRCFGIKASDTTAKPSLLDAITGDLARWQVHAEFDALRDLVDKENFRYAALTVRIPSGKDTFVDFKREIGSKAPSFTKGSQYGLYLTVQY